MIAHDQKAIFVHVPKVAGQSIEHVFIELAGLTWETRAPLLLRKNDDPSVGPERLAHLLAREYFELGHISREQFDSYFSFAFVRNPWARLVSEYRYRINEGVGEFSEFVETGFAGDDMFSDYHRHIIPQVRYLDDAEGKQIVDFVGHFETLDADFAHVAQTLGLPSSQLPHRNKAGGSRLKRLKAALFGKPVEPKRPFQEYFSPALRDRVGEYYSEDIARFGYEFDRAAPSSTAS